MPTAVFRYLSLFLVLATLSCPEAAPSADKDSKVEQLVRVYPINEEQYEKLLQFTNGKNVISEARLTSAGFTSVRNSLDSGWNSLLRIMGLTTTSRSEVAKIDIDGQPLCVMRRSFDESEARATSDEDSVINCIVVLKKDSISETQSADSSNPSFAPYWYQENPVQTAPQQHPFPLEPQASQLIAQQEVSPAEDDEERQVATTTPAPKVKKLRSKPKSKSNSRSKLQKKKTALNAEASRQYGSPFGAPTSPYGSPYGGAYPYGGFNQNPYGGFNPYAFLSAKSFLRTTLALQSLSIL
ncbi:uncharacterized protein LOC117785856 [Drosophila innubila]|uniref:uncharacterized protein LOC117785856 n=1 Tax=Drosophila innubila TaxID=198719 RepID=UPI00148C7DB4|nr:uncharacterized protein LOC117785856 [Drosophila innubila]